MMNRMGLRRKFYWTFLIKGLAICTVLCGFCLPVAAAELHLYAGAGLRQPVDQLIEMFQQRTGHCVMVDYDGSGRLLARIRVSGQGDLFMPGSLFFIQKLEQQGRIHSLRPIVAHTPVIALNQNTKAKIRSLENLARPGVRVALGDPKAMALGKTAAVILKRSGLAEAVQSNVSVYGATVKQLALYVAEGMVDASIIGRADAFQFRDRIKMISIPEALYDPETIAIAVLDSSTDLKAACALRNYLSAPASRKVFERFGFLPFKGGGE